MDTAILEDLGLTRAEIKVFLSALEIGSTAAGPIVERSGLQNSVVHRTLHSLIQKGLVTYVLEGQKKAYQAVSPEQLLNYIDRKKEGLKKILPELIEKQKLAKRRPQAQIYQGTRGVKELINSLLETDEKKYCGYGGPQKSVDLLGDHFWRSFEVRRFEKGIKARVIFHSSLRKRGKGLVYDKLAQVRFTSQGFEELTETMIIGDKVAVIAYSDMPFGFLMESQEVAESYKRFFEMLWNTSTG